MRTSKKLLSVLLAVLMCMSCFGLLFIGFAAGDDPIVVTSIAATSSFQPTVGGAFPTESDFTAVANGTVPLSILRVAVSEVDGDSETFRSGKAYQVLIAVQLPSDSDYGFRTGATDITINGEPSNCSPAYERYNNKIATLLFEYRMPANITVSCDPAAGGTVTGGGSYALGSTATLSATPKPGYIFDGWFKVSGIHANRYSDERTLSLTVDQNYSFIAVFREAEVGDLIEYGTYPQTQVDETPALKAAAEDAAWKNCYIKFGETPQLPDDQGRFADFFYEGEKYRAVRINSYYHHTAHLAQGTDELIAVSCQEENGYPQGATYYFKYEPLLWRVLDPETGLILCESIIDNQPIQNVYWKNPSDGDYYQGANSSVLMNNYATSYIRNWLNEDFYQTAFTTSQQANIQTTELANNEFWIYVNDWMYGEHGRFVEFVHPPRPVSNDKVFLLSVSDTVNTAYGFGSNTIDPDAKRVGYGTDYAKCQGLWVKNGAYAPGSSFWWLRSPCAFSGVNEYTSYVSIDGVTTTDFSEYDYFSNGERLRYENYSYLYSGIRPACRLTYLAEDTTVSEELTSSEGVCKVVTSVNVLAYGEAGFWRPTEEDYLHLISTDSFPLGETVLVQAFPKAGYRFAGWYKVTLNPDGSVSNKTLVSKEDSYYFVADTAGILYLEARFEENPNYQPLIEIGYYDTSYVVGTWSVTYGGHTYQEPESFRVNKGTRVALHGYNSEIDAFVGWYENGELLTTDQDYTFTANQDRSLIYRAFDFAFGVNRAQGSAVGRVEKMNDDGSLTVYIEAFPNPGYRCTGWYNKSSGNQTTEYSYRRYKTSGNTTNQTPRFEPVAMEHSITTSASPAEGGKVMGGGVIYMGSANPSVISFHAEANPGYHFVGWYRNGTKVRDESYTTWNVSPEDVTEDWNIVGKFEKDATPEPTTYTVTVNASAGGKASGGGTFDEGATATLTATPNSGYHFTGWYEGSTKVSDKTPYSFTVTKDVTLTAQFEKDADPGNNGGNNNPQPQPSANRCHWCGKDHSGNFFQKIIGFFHNIFAKIFGNKY